MNILPKIRTAFLQGAMALSFSFSAGLAQETPIDGLYSVGTHQLYLKCMGTGSPTVVLDGRATSPHSSWLRVMPKVAQFTRVCGYDRASLGRSEAEPSGQVRTSKDLARDWHTLLQNAGVQGPYVVVGALFGSFNARLFTAQNLDKVAGLVLVEAEDLEVARNLSTFVLRAEPWDVVKSAQEAEEALSRPGILGARPLVLVTRGMGLTEQWDQFHKSLLPMSSNSRQVIAENSTDEIPSMQPGAVIDAIQAVVESVRTGEALK